MARTFAARLGSQRPKDPRRSMTGPVLLLVALVLGASPLPGESDAKEEALDRPAIRLLPPAGPVAGMTPIEALAIDREIARLVFSIDGETAATRKRPPWEVRLPLADPPREQTVEVVAYDDLDRFLGMDEIVVNRSTPPLAVRLVAIEGDRTRGPVRVRASVSVPRKARLASVHFYRGDALVETRDAAPFEVELAGPVAGDELVRVVLTLADGRTVEDAALLSTAEFAAEVDVNLVQLQTLVTTRRGMPIRDLGPDDFSIVQSGRVQTLDQLYAGLDLALVIGVVVNAAGSEREGWEETVGAVDRLLDATLGPKDRGFLIDFDAGLRLAQPLTGDRMALEQALAALEPDERRFRLTVEVPGGSVIPVGRGADAGGRDVLRPPDGTAIYDAMLYSLLQYHGEPGRRALVVVTDGVDSGSLVEPDRVVAVAHRLGVPIYIVALAPTRDESADGFGRGSGTGVRRGATAPGAGIDAGRWQRSRDDGLGVLKQIADGTGGRLLRTRGGRSLGRAFDQIAIELRSHYVLTYYADEIPEEGIRSIDVRVEGRPELDVRAVLPLDQAN